MVPSTRWTVGRRIRCPVVVGDCDDCHVVLVGDALELVEYLPPGFAVEVTRRFVGENDLRAVDERAGDGDALLLAAGEFVGLVAQSVTEPSRSKSVRPVCCFRRRRSTQWYFDVLDSSQRRRKEVFYIDPQVRRARCAAAAEAGHVRPSSRTVPSVGVSSSPRC